MPIIITLNTTLEKRQGFCLKRVTVDFDWRVVLCLNFTGTNRDMMLH